MCVCVCACAACAVCGVCACLNYVEIVSGAVTTDSQF